MRILKFNRILLLIIIIAMLYGILQDITIIILLAGFFSFFNSVVNSDFIQSKIRKEYYFIIGIGIKKKSFSIMVCIALSAILFFITKLLIQIPAPFKILETKNFGNVLMGISIIIS